MLSCTEHRPLVAVAEELVCNPLQVAQVVRVSANAAQDAEHELKKERTAHEAAINEVPEVVEMADVITLVFEAGAVHLTQSGKDLLDVTEGVAEYRVARPFEILALPRVLEVR